MIHCNPLQQEWNFKSLQNCGQGSVDEFREVVQCHMDKGKKAFVGEANKWGEHWQSKVIRSATRKDT